MDSVFEDLGLQHWAIEHLVPIGYIEYIGPALLHNELGRDVLEPLGQGESGVDQVASNVVDTFLHHPQPAAAIDGFKIQGNFFVVKYDDPNPSETQSDSGLGYTWSLRIVHWIKEQELEWKVLSYRIRDTKRGQLDMQTFHEHLQRVIQQADKKAQLFGTNQMKGNDELMLSSNLYNAIIKIDPHHFDKT